jgi:IclR family acetate operon transcriptional repressor
MLSDFTDDRLLDHPAKEVHSVGRALAILESLTRSDHELGVSEISKVTGLAIGTVHRLLATLAYHGYVRRNSQTRKYGPGIKLLSVAAAAHGRIGAISRPFLTELMEVSGESSNLAALEKNSVVYLDQVPAARMVRMFTEPGNRSPLHSTGTGKVLLAYQPAEIIDSIIGESGLPRFTACTMTDPKQLKDELERIRERGYALDSEEMEEGVRCLAAPIFGPDGSIVAGISISGPVGRLGDSRLDELIPLIKRIALDLSESLSHTTSDYT